MPPPKGNFAATNVVLSLFVGQPETVGSIRRRLRREYADAHWSRSIVDHAIPALESQGFITLIEAGKKLQDWIYEITAAGREEFRRWVRESSRRPAPIREPLLLWIEHSTPDELPALLAIIKETEEAAKQKLAIAKRRLDAERERGMFGPSDSSDWNGRIRYAIYHDRVLYWHGRVARFLAMRQILRAQRERHQRIPESGDDDA
jgi:DNA-binding PadR family transcriptional regulator